MESIYHQRLHSMNETIFLSSTSFRWKLIKFIVINSARKKILNKINWLDFISPNVNGKYLKSICRHLQLQIFVYAFTQLCFALVVCEWVRMSVRVLPTVATKKEQNVVKHTFGYFMHGRKLNHTQNTLNQSHFFFSNIPFEHHNHVVVDDLNKNASIKFVNKNVYSVN